MVSIGFWYFFGVPFAESQGCQGPCERWSKPKKTSRVEAECDIWILDVERSPFAWQEAGPSAELRHRHGREFRMVCKQMTSCWIILLHRSSQIFTDQEWHFGYGFEFESQNLKIRKQIGSALRRSRWSGSVGRFRESTTLQRPCWASRVVPRRHGQHGASGNEDFANLNMDNMASRNSGFSH